MDALSARDLGVPVTDHRTSWVRHVSVDAIGYYVKTYDYSTVHARLRGWGRNTFVRSSRAAREWDALAWLGRHGFARPDPIGVLEDRRRGVLWRAVLVTTAWTGTPVDALLTALGSEARNSLTRAVAHLVLRLHRAGFRDRNLDARNLLARERDGQWCIAKLDSPRYRLVRADLVGDSLAESDWERLRRSCVALETGLGRASVER